MYAYTSLAVHIKISKLNISNKIIYVCKRESPHIIKIVHKIRNSTYDKNLLNIEKSSWKLTA